MFDESKHPRDAKGRFTDGKRSDSNSSTYKAALNAAGYDTTDMSDEWAEHLAKDIGADKRIHIPLDFFAEKGLEKQSARELRKGIRHLKKEIERHKVKILNPDRIYSNWTSVPEHIKQGYIEHWKKETKTFEESIDNRIKRLKELGESE